MTGQRARVGLDLTISGLRLSGPRPEQLVFPAAGWAMKGQLVVTHDTSSDVPPVEQRSCMTYSAREQKGTLTLNLSGPGGRSYSIRDAPLEISQAYTCDKYSF